MVIEIAASLFFDPKARVVGSVLGPLTARGYTFCDRPASAIRPTLRLAVWKLPL